VHEKDKKHKALIEIHLPTLDSQLSAMC
jgi:hypothetical protein